MKKTLIRAFPVAAVAAGVAIVLALRADDDVKHVRVNVRYNAEHADRASDHAEHAQDHAEHVQEHAEHQHQRHIQFECGDDGSMELRLAALIGLITMDTDKAMPILKPVLQNRESCSVELRRKAVFLVSQHETEETIPLLHESAVDESRLRGPGAGGVLDRTDFTSRSRGRARIDSERHKRRRPAREGDLLTLAARQQSRKRHPARLCR